MDQLPCNGSALGNGGVADSRDPPVGDLTGVSQEALALNPTCVLTAVFQRF